MEYHGKLYGKIGHKYFDTGKTSTDYDKIESDKIELVKMLKRMLSNYDEGTQTYLDCIELIKRATE